jgi:hypothetical protein
MAADNTARDTDRARDLMKKIPVTRDSDRQRVR